MTSDAKKLTVPYEQFEPERLTFTDFEENDRSKGQLISYARYNHPTLGEGQQLMLLLPFCKIFNYGVPRAGGDYYNTDRERSFLKLPIDENNEEQMVIVKKLEAVDETLESDKKKKEMFGKKKTKYVYNRIVREAQTDDDKERPRYIKLKLETKWPSGEILTQVYKSELKDVDGKEKRVRTPIEVSTVDEFADVVRYQSNVRMIIRPVKMWAQPASRKDPGYGIVFKIVKIEVEPSETGGNSLKDYYNNDAFLDSDDDDDEVNEVKEVVSNMNMDDDSDSSDSDSDSDEEEVVAKKKKSKSKKN
jgi:hypothetical protein